MIVRDTTWQKIRGQFSAADKVALRNAYDGEVLCPRGLVIDEDKLTDDLKKRLKVAVDKSW